MSGSPSGDDEISILHVDDDEAFGELVAEALERENDRFRVATVASAADGLTELAAGEYDCVVSDYDMPGRDGIAFLEEVRADHPELPFLLFTGKGSEEVASEAISSGVTDYLQKSAGTDQYTILANRVTNAVAQHRAVREVSRTREYFGRLLEHASDFLLVVDSQGEIDYVSPAIERVLGYTPEEQRGMDAFEQIHPEDLTIASTAFADLLEEPDRDRAVEYRARHADGSWRWLAVRGRNRLSDPRIEGILVSARDVTERKRREERLERERDRFETVFEQAIDAMVIADEAGTFVEVNRRASELFGLSAEELVGRSLVDFAPADVDFETAWETFQNADADRDQLGLVTPAGEELGLEYAASRDILPGEDLSVLRVPAERDGGNGA